MTEIVQTLRVGDTLAMARRQIERGGVHHLPVIDDDEHVIGLITYHRILEAWLSHGRPNTESVAEVAGDVRFAQRHFEAERKRKPPAQRANKKAKKKAKRRGSSTSRSAKRPKRRSFELSKPAA